MKKIFTLILLNFSVFVAFGQQMERMVEPRPEWKVSQEELRSIKSRTGDVAREVTTLYVDYPVCDQLERGAESATNYLWTFNSGYDANDTDVVAFNYLGVRMTALSGYTDVTLDPIETYTGLLPYPDNLVVTIDSIYVLLSHENNSGVADSIVLELRETNAQGNLLPNNPLVWSNTTVSSTTLSPGGNWVGSGAVYLLSVPCGYQTLESQRVGVTLRYVAPETDTLALVASYVSNPNGPATPNDIAMRSLYPHSYFRWMGALNNNVVNAGNVYYPPQTGQDTAYFKVQNWQIWTAVTFDDAASAQQQKMILPLSADQNYPNPLEYSSSFNYTLNKAQHLSIEIMNAEGKLISQKNLGWHAAGAYNAELPVAGLSNGIYFYRLIGDNQTSAQRRFIVSK
jgi:hypothetical protein